MEKADIIRELAYKHLVQLILLDVMDLNKLLECGLISQRHYESNISKLKYKMLSEW